MEAHVYAQSINGLVAYTQSEVRGNVASNLLAVLILADGALKLGVKLLLEL